MAFLCPDAAAKFSMLRFDVHMELHAWSAMRMPISFIPSCNACGGLLLCIPILDTKLSLLFYPPQVRKELQILAWPGKPWTRPHAVPTAEPGVAPGAHVYDALIVGGGQVRLERVIAFFVLIHFLSTIWSA